MKKLLKPSSLLFSLLCLLVFFLLGMFVAGWIGAGKGQGLAGGAIVFGWGLMFAFVAFVSSFFLTSYLQQQKIIRLNWVLLAALLIGFATTFYKFKHREAQRNEVNKSLPQKTKEAPFEN